MAEVITSDVMCFSVGRQIWFIFSNNRWLCPGASRHTPSKAFSRSGPEHRCLQLSSVCGDSDHHAPYRLLPVTAHSQSAGEKHGHTSPPTACYCVQCAAGKYFRKISHSCCPQNNIIQIWALLYQALSNRFCGEISDDKINICSFFPDEYFTCPSTCLSCR